MLFTFTFNCNSAIILEIDLDLTTVRVKYSGLAPLGSLALDIFTR